MTYILPRGVSRKLGATFAANVAIAKTDNIAMGNSSTAGIRISTPVVYNHYSQSIGGAIKKIEQYAK